MKRALQNSGMLRTLLVWGVLTAAVVLVYGGTLKAPWYFDDISIIVENPAIHDFRFQLGQLFDTSRSLVLWTFALNYRLGGLEVQGYHLVNIVIHLLTVLLVYAIFLRILAGRQILAVAGALLFAVHPLQTQAVTYLVQRMTCLSGFFFFLAILLFLCARRERSQGASCGTARHLVSYGGALLAGALAVSIKQNAAILPLVLALLVWLSPEEKLVAEGWRARLLYLLPFALAPLAAVVQQVLLPLFSGNQLADMGAVQTLSTMARPSSLHYLVTEFSVLWLYLRLFILPIGQALEYAYPVVKEIWTLPSLLALTGLLGLILLAWRLRHRRPLVTLGIFWFFITLAVESTVIPLDPVFEHRMYVPIFGLVLIVLDLLAGLTRPRIQVAIFCLLILGLGLLAWRRNQLWNDPIAFYQDNLRSAPQSERVNVDLAKRFMDVGRNAEAEVLLKRALEINPDFEITYVNLSKIYADRGDYTRARDLLVSAENRFAKSVKYLDNLGTILDLIGDPVQAERVLRQAIILDPSYANTYLNLGALYARQGHWDDAIALYRQSLSRFPEKSILCFNYGVALYSLERFAEARDQFRRAYQLDPRDADSAYNLGVVNIDLGDRASAVALLPELRALDAGKALDLEEELARPASAGHK